MTSLASSYTESVAHTSTPTERSYYLDHNVNDCEGYPECIYTHLWNSKEWSDSNTIVCGQNMRSGTMFQSFHLFEDVDFSLTISMFIFILRTKRRLYTKSFRHGLPEAKIYSRLMTI